MSSVVTDEDQDSPLPIRRATVRHAAELKAEALAMIVAGQSSTTVARKLGIPKSTVLSWWHDHGPVEPRSVRQREILGEQVYDTVKTTLEALATRARLTADEDWIREQSAAALAHLDAVHWDRVIRLLSALRPAEPVPTPETEDLDLEA
jgi:transposase-like protein